MFRVALRPAVHSAKRCTGEMSAAEVKIVLVEALTISFLVLVENQTEIVTYIVAIVENEMEKRLDIKWNVGGFM